MLQDLPVELLSLIVSYLSSARDIQNLNCCNKKLHDFVEKAGWRAFVRTRFPSLPVLGHWKDASQSLTLLSRNWDRYSIMVNYFRHGPQASPMSPYQSLGQVRPSTQTMGFQSVIDSYEVSDGLAWNSRKEFVAWAAGSQFLIRVTDWKTRQSHKQSRRHPNSRANQNRWLTYKPPKSVEGIDDITSLKLLRPPHLKKDCTASILFGTASGSLSIVHLDLTDSGCTSVAETKLETSSSSIQSLDISPSGQLAAAVVNKTSLALYDINQDVDTIQPIYRDALGNVNRVWTSKFLSDSRIAIGCGPSVSPLLVYGILPTGLSDGPLWNFDPLGLRKTSNPVYHPSRNDRSATAIKPLSWNSSSGHDPGQVFLSGMNDGIVRLHDTRDPRKSGPIFHDPFDGGAVYSLETLGRERLIVGNSRNALLKLFDLRVPGGRAYSYLDASAQAPLEESPWSRYHNINTGSSLFIYPNTQLYRGRIRPQIERTRRSPVYSLSIPSPTSPTLYAGLEGSIAQLDFVSQWNHRSDYASASVSRYVGDRGLKGWHSLAMYKHSQPNTLMKQRQKKEKPVSATTDGMDERWMAY